MASDPKERINLAALQQNDPYIERILETAGQVALYNFNAEANEWEKTDVQGTMFIYTRSATPYHGFIIMNRLSMHNFTEPITKEMEFQRNDPFLLYKSADSIHGIWFYNKDLCLNVTRSLEQLVYKLSVRAQKGPKQRTKSLGECTRPLAQKKQEVQTKGSIDIMQMLSKAQHEYNQTKTVSTKDVGKPIPQSEPQVIRPIPMKVDGQNASGDGSLTVVQVKGQQHESTQPRTGPPKFKRSVSVQERSKDDDVKSGEVPPLLQRLFSQSDASQVQVVSTSGDMMKTVESLERLHVADIEGGDSSRTDPSGSESGKKPIDSLLQMLSYNEEQSIAKRSPLTPEALQKPTGFSNVAAGSTGHTVEPQLISHEAPHRIASKGLNPLLMKPGKTISQQAVSLPGLSRGTASSNSMAISPDFGAGGDAGMSLTMLGQASPTEGAVVPTSPQTIPASFTPSQLLTPSLIQRTPSSGLLVPMAMTSKDSSRVSPVPTLTKEQFKEAYLSMLQNDSEFVSKLHEAYLQVLSKPKT